jgi:HD-GYP domain-containing protein (c-di-GMP phosphodiesterase class II)/DNA-binding CsgD family transcriptional regulator
MAFADARLRITELLASLSLATDLGTGQPLGHGLSTSLLAVDTANELGCAPDQVRHVQQTTLIRFIGCNADAAETAHMAGGDDLSLMSAFAPAHMGSTAGAAFATVKAVGMGRPLPRRARLVAAALIDPGAAEGLAAHCEVGSMLARRLGLEAPVVLALQHAYERWDGGGNPAGLEGGQIPLETRIAIVARDADLFARAGDDVAAILRRRRGKAYDPDVVDAVIKIGPAPREAEWVEVLAAEPEPAAFVIDIDHALDAVADYADLKSSWTRGHSPAVAALAAEAARLAGLDEEAQREIRRAALVHDLGRVGVANGVWDKKGTLAASEWERVRLHPYLTQRVLDRCKPLAGLARIASSHHERVDGTGYHRGSSGDDLSVEARVLAAADVMQALTTDRPHRPAWSLKDAVGKLDEEASAGHLDPEAVAVVIQAAGGAAKIPAPANPGGLTDREVEVLRLVARGNTNKEIGERLFISPKTVGRHVENIYTKIGVSTRAGAALYAMEHRLLG